MSALSSEQLEEQITSVPNELQKALEQQAKARMAVAHLETQISKLESEIERAGEQEDDADNPDNDGLEDNLELVRMESAVERLKVKSYGGGRQGRDCVPKDHRKDNRSVSEGGFRH